MKTKLISNLLLAIFLAFIFIPRPLLSQVQPLSQLDSLNSAKQIKIELRQKKLTKSIIFSSIAATALLGAGTVFLINSSKLDQQAILKYPVSPVSNTSQDWTRDLKYQFSDYNTYLRSVSYRNSVVEEEKRLLLKESGTNKLLGFLSYTCSSIFAVNLVFKVSEKNRLKLSFY